MVIAEGRLTNIREATMCKAKGKLAKNTAIFIVRHTSGGLKTRSRFESESMIPLLGDIPILGYLFRSTNVQTTYSEVLFMITPRIIYGFEGVEVEDDLGNDG